MSGAGTECGEPLVDCKLSDWADWGACSATCGYAGEEKEKKKNVLRCCANGTCSSSVRHTTGEMPF